MVKLPPIPPRTPTREALDNARHQLAKAELDGKIAAGGGVFTALGYLGYLMATEGPFAAVIPDNPNIIVTALFAALTLGFIGKAAVEVGNAGRWGVVAGARWVASKFSSKGAPLEPPSPLER